jgi:hypothetical protein
MRKRTVRRVVDPSNRRLRTEPWRIAAVFAPIEAILDEIAKTGQVQALRNGAPVFYLAAENTWYETAPAVVGICDLFDALTVRTGQTYPTEPLSQFAKRLSYSMPLTREDIDAALAVLPALRAAAGNLTVAEGQSLTLTTQIRVEIEQLQAV